MKNKTTNPFISKKVGNTVCVYFGHDPSENPEGEFVLQVDELWVEQLIACLKQSTGKR